MKYQTYSVMMNYLNGSRCSLDKRAGEKEGCLPYSMHKHKGSADWKDLIIQPANMTKNTYLFPVMASGSKHRVT